MNILVTGGLGFLGSEIIRHHLKQNPESTIYAVVRKRGQQSATTRWQTLVRKWNKAKITPTFDPKQVKIIDLDVAQVQNAAELGKQLSGAKIKTVFHCAARTEFDLPLIRAKEANLASTLGALSLSRNLPDLERFVHFSTAFVSGTLSGNVTTSMNTTSFNNTYEESKWLCEEPVRNSELSYTILRPSIVVGDSKTGYSLDFRTIYSLIRIWLTGLLNYAPIRQSASVDIVPIDFVCKAALTLAADASAKGKTLHLCSGKYAPSPTEIVDQAIRTFDAKPIRTIHPWIARMLMAAPLRYLVKRVYLDIYQKLKWHFPYMNTKGRTFITVETDLLLKKHELKCPRFRDYGANLFGYCRESRWGKKEIEGV